MKKSLWAAALFVGFALSGCGDDKPSDKLASETVHKFAEPDLLNGLEIADFKRDNGWVDNEATNRYKVRYTYNLRLKKPYAQAVLGSAQELQKELEAESKKSGKGFFDVNAMQNGLQSMQLTMMANKWVQDQGDGFSKRRDNFLGTCAACVAYWNNEDVPAEASIRRRLFINAWAMYEELGFKDAAKVGDSVPRSAWAAFIKTEKGWQTVQ